MSCFVSLNLLRGAPTGEESAMKVINSGVIIIMGYVLWVDVLFAVLFGLAICFNLYSIAIRSHLGWQVLLLVLYMTLSLLRTHSAHF